MAAKRSTRGFTLHYHLDSTFGRPSASRTIRYAGSVSALAHISNDSADRPTDQPASCHPASRAALYFLYTNLCGTSEEPDLAGWAQIQGDTKHIYSPVWWLLQFDKKRRRLENRFGTLRMYQACTLLNMKISHFSILYIYISQDGGDLFWNSSRVLTHHGLVTYYNLGLQIGYNYYLLFTQGDQISVLF